MCDVKWRILIADDNLTMRRILQFTLERAGFETAVASDGKVAWELAKKQLAFDAAIVDCQMPEMDGLELSGNLRSLSSFASAPILMLTAKGYEIDRQVLAERFGISTVVSKPFSPAKLVLTVKEMLAPQAADQA